MEKRNLEEPSTVEARMLDKTKIPPDLIIKGEGPEAAVTIIEIPGNLSTIQIDLVREVITRSLNLDVSPNTIAIARVLNNPTFGQTPIRIQLPKTSAARLILKFQQGDANVEPQEGPFIDRFGLPPAFEDFTGREDSLALLETVGQNAVISHPKKTVSGTGGIGKTQLAVTFAHRKLKQFQETKGKAGYRSIIWFIASTDEGIDNQGLMTEQMHRLGQQLGFDPKQLTPEALIKLIYERLEKEHGPYLVVFDNAPNLRSIQSFCPPSSVPVIITTRNFNERDWGQSFEFIPLTVFTDNEAHLYIKKVLCRNHEDLYEEKEANALATALGNFPLALTQALAYITNENMRISAYLEELSQQKDLYLQEPVAQGDPYQKDKNPVTGEYVSRPKEEYDPHKSTVWSVVQLSLKKVMNSDAQQVLKVCAYLASEVPIDLNLLSKWTADIAKCREVVLIWRRYSLLENVSLANHVRIHQLVQDILKLGDKEEAQKLFLISLVDFMGQYYETENNPLADEARKKILLPHLQAVLNQIEKCSNADKLFPQKRAILWLYLGNINSEMENPKEAARYYKEALKVYESYQDEVRVAITLMNLGKVTLALGDALAAQACLERALPILEQTYGPENHLVAKALGNLGNTTLALGDASKAKAIFQQVLTIQIHIYGSAHVEVAKTLINLGNTNLELGVALEAKAHLKRALQILEDIYGLKHPLVAKALLNLGNTILVLGNASKAKTLLERALAILEHTYGLKHSLVAKAYVTLGSAILTLGDTARAKALFEHGRSILEGIDGSADTEVAMTLMNLGVVTAMLGDAAGGKDLLERALAIQIRLYGPMHPQGALTLMNLGETILALGHAWEAKMLLKPALSILERTYGPKHPDVARALVNLGNATGNFGDVLGARVLFERALAIKEQIYDPGHQEVALTRFNLGLTFAQLGQPNIALQHIRPCYKVFSNYFGPQHPSTLKVRYKIEELQKIQNLSSNQSHSFYELLIKNTAWIRLLNQLLEGPLPLQPHHLLLIAQGCFDEELFSETLGLLDCIPEESVSFGVAYLRAECQLCNAEFIECSETISRCQVLAEEDLTQTYFITFFLQKKETVQRQAKQWEAELNDLKSKITLTMKDQMQIVNLLCTLRRFEEALSLVNNIIANQPTVEFLALAYFNQAQCYFGLQRYIEAKKSCDESYRLNERPEVQTLSQKIKLAIVITPQLLQLLDQLAYNSRSVLNL